VQTIGNDVGYRMVCSTGAETHMGLGKLKNKILLCVEKNTNFQPGPKKISKKSFRLIFFTLNFLFGKSNLKSEYIFGIASL
jgi:hypothetical protein